jgi:hypothetical protein
LSVLRAISLGSAIWGQVAALVDLPAAHFLAAVGRILQDAVDRFHAQGTPKVTHLIASEPGLGAAKTKLP